jgi:signal transduction histidine kinase
LITMKGDRAGWWRRGPAPPWVLSALAVLLAGVATSYQQLPWWVSTGALLAPVIGVALLPTYPIISLGLGTTASVAMALALGDSVPVWSVALGATIFVISVLAGRQMPRTTHAPVVFVAGTTLALPLGLAHGNGGAWLSALLLLGVTVVLPWILGRALRQQAELVAVTAERARLQERSRIAYDMHDTLGHELSLLALRAGALELAADLDDRHRAAAADLRAGAGLATERLAEIVTVLRDGEPVPLHPGPDRIEDLVERAIQAGAAVSLNWDGTRDLPPRAGRAAHRVVQEALTNALKHVHGRPVHVRLATVADTTTVTVTNPVNPGARPGPGGHAGLTGLHERVRLAGGTLDAGPRGHTFQVIARLPHADAS